ncbi:ABC transporter ATP-binding protein [Nocardioides carbamazepini]|uniref:ABC transporter ATP-binding protein n=1 Tax=Nocardioides carbamazepini TaxID=2854259 RepID=UPI002149F975|nr:ABC transporter ATP-binding protein [Nocardioides carbamazepini]MCR1786024.1 ABC transporter ATP-binding protein [Nocardioides carbamazepini]
MSTATLAPPAIVLDGVARSYGSRAGRVDALRGVTHAFAPGSFTAIMGPSGSGKSTLLQCAAGLDRPTSGRVLVAGHDLGLLSEAALTRLRRDAMGFVFQAYNLLPALTAYDNVALPARLAGRRPPRDEVAAALTRVGLDTQQRRRPAELSGGQQQRVAIARALVTRPQVVYADEPTGALDRTTGRQVLELVRSTVDTEGLTVVMVTHDPVAASYADSVLFLADGLLVGHLARGTATQIAAAMNELER